MIPALDVASAVVCITAIPAHVVAPSRFGRNARCSGLHGSGVGDDGGRGNRTGGGDQCHRPGEPHAKGATHRYELRHGYTPPRHAPTDGLRSMNVGTAHWFNEVGEKPTQSG